MPMTQQPTGLNPSDLATFANGELRKQLATFDVTPERGFLPAQDPLRRLPAGFDAWEQIAGDLPKLLMTDQLRAIVNRIPRIDPSSLKNSAELERAMMLLSYIGHAYVWTGGGKPATSIPPSLAVPWHALSVRLGRPPVLSYASYALHNWRRIDPNRGVELGNIALLQNFWGGADEEWFILIHVDIEARAAAAVRSLIPAQHAAADRRPQELLAHLSTIRTSLEGMYATMLRMPEFCDPYIYYNRVRPYIHGWKNHPALPKGLKYEGVQAYSEPQKFRGETGAQSSIVPALDAVLGVSHQNDPLREYLNEMRQYMPPAHNAFVKHLESGPSIRQYVCETCAASCDPKIATPLKETYNACVKLVEMFRDKHLEYAASYIYKQAPKGEGNPTDVGTGGTPFMPYLKKHRDETAAHRLE